MYGNAAGGAEISMNDKAPTLTASAGMSGNNQPVICFDPKALSDSECATSIMGENAKDNPCVCYTKTSFGQYAEGVGTLRANGGDIGGAVRRLLSGNDGEVIAVDCHNLNWGGRTMTLMCSRNDDHSIPVVAYTFEPGILLREGGHYYKDVSGTIRANAGDNQMSVAYGFKPGQGASAQGLGYEEEKSPTLNTSSSCGGYSNQKNLCDLLLREQRHEIIKPEQRNIRS